jgi:hypothetical protein
MAEARKSVRRMALRAELTVEPAVQAVDAAD